MKLLLVVLCLSLTSTAFAKKPRYTLKSKTVLGAYRAIKDANCIDGHDVCDEAQILKKKGKLMIHFGGYYSDRYIPLKQAKSGVLVFSESNYDDDCDDSGCANVLKISGVVYPKRVKGKYIPQVKARIDLECGHNDYEPEGCSSDEDYHYTIKMRK